MSTSSRPNSAMPTAFTLFVCITHGSMLLSPWQYRSAAKEKVKYFKDPFAAYLDLAVSPMEDRTPRAVPGIFIRVDLDVQGQSLDPLLGAEVRAQALYGDVHLGRGLQRIPVDGECVVADLLNGPNQSCTHAKDKN